MKVKEIERIRAAFLKSPGGRARKGGPKSYPREWIEALYADYLLCGEVVAHVASRWRRAPGSVATLLEVHGLRKKSPELSEQIKRRQRDAGGKMMADQHASPAELEAIIQREVQRARGPLGKGTARMRIPPELGWEFKTWTMDKRGWFITRLRAEIKSPNDRPETPFSSNVTPFDYTTPAAREIMARLNAGLNSREAVCKINLCSQGVIYEGALYFWAGANTGYCKQGKWTPENGRPQLNRVIWEKTNGRKVPPKHVVFYRDGNMNNLDPDNLGLMSMNENARRNQAASLFRKSRETTALLLKRAQRKEKSDGLIETLRRAA